MAQTSAVPPSYFGLVLRYDVSSPSLKGGFSRVTGLKEEIDVEEKRDGIRPFQTRKIVGGFKGGTLTLAKGVLKDFSAFYDWYLRVKKFYSKYRETVEVQINNYEGDPIRKVRFIEAWPFSYELGDLDAKTSDVAVETISIAFEKMEFIKVPGGGGESSAESPAGPMTSPRALRGMGGV